MESLSTITIKQIDINVKTSSLGNAEECEKRDFYFLLQMISQSVSLSIALQL
jgi:hypothetical protein